MRLDAALTELAQALANVDDEQQEELLQLYTSLAKLAASQDSGGAAVLIMDALGDGRGQVAVMGNSFLVQPLLDSAHEAMHAHTAQTMTRMQ